MLLPDAKPKPPSERRLVGLALAGVLFVVEARSESGAPNVPSLVPGLLPQLLPVRLMLEPGRGGGPILMLLLGEKKLDSRLSLGVVGRPCKLPIVRSLKEGLEAFRDVGTTTLSTSAGTWRSVV